MAENPSGREAMTDALRRLTREDVPGVELLLLNQVMGWVFSEANSGADYGTQEVAFLGRALFTSLEGASTTSLAHQPEETDAITRARDRLADGAQELASQGEAGLDLLIQQRIVPAMIGELERSAGNPTKQGACTWAYLLYSVSTGERHDNDEQILAGFLESFDAWSALLDTL